MSKDEKRDFLLDIWERVKKKKKNYSIVIKWGLVDLTTVVDEEEMVSWEEVETIFDEVASELEDKDTTDEKNIREDS